MSERQPRSSLGRIGVVQRAREVEWWEQRPNSKDWEDPLRRLDEEMSNAEWELIKTSLGIKKK